MAEHEPKIRVMKTVSEGTKEIIAARMHVKDPAALFGEYSALALLHGDVCDMIYASDVAQKTASVKVFEIPGSCVIVGRCADYILGEKENCLKVFIHASLEKRAERIVKVYGEREESPQKRLQDKDKRRKSYYRFYTNMEWGVAENYHIALDSGVIGIGKCVDIIADLY